MTAIRRESLDLNWSPTNLSFNTERHMYFDNGGDKPRNVPGVTSRLGKGVGKGFLNQWYAKLSGLRAVEALDILPELVEREGAEYAAQYVARAAKDSMNWSAGLGTEFHNSAEAVFKETEMPTITRGEEVSDMVAAWEKWQTDWDVSFVFVESGVWNQTHNYAGQADAFVKIPRLSDKPILLDNKTGEKGPYADYALQLAAYANAEKLVDFEREVETDMIELETEFGLILKIRPDGYKLYRTRQSLDTLFGIFRAVLTTADWVTQYDRTAFIGPYPNPVTVDSKPFFAKVQTANDVDEVRLAYVEAETAGVTNLDELLAACLSRKSELEAGSLGKAA